MDEYRTDTICIEVWDQVGRLPRFQNIRKLIVPATCGTPNIRLIGGFQLPVEVNEIHCHSFQFFLSNQSFQTIPCPLIICYDKRKRTKDPWNKSNHTIIMIYD